MTEYPYCESCKHYKGKFKCPAFKDKIPDEILIGKNEHKKPLPEQNNKIIFEPIEKK